VAKSTVEAATHDDVLSPTAVFRIINMVAKVSTRRAQTRHPLAQLPALAGDLSVFIETGTWRAPPQLPDHSDGGLHQAWRRTRGPLRPGHCRKARTERGKPSLPHQLWQLCQRFCGLDRIAFSPRHREERAAPLKNSLEYKRIGVFPGGFAGGLSASGCCFSRQQLSLGDWVASKPIIEAGRRSARWR